MKTILFYLTNVLDFLRSNLNATYFYENLSTTIVLCPSQCPHHTSQTQAICAYQSPYTHRLYVCNTDFFHTTLRHNPQTISMYVYIKNRQLRQTRLDNP